jgi:hypothetical protein
MINGYGSSLGNDGPRMLIQPTNLSFEFIESWDRAPLAVSVKSGRFRKAIMSRRSSCARHI